MPGINLKATLKLFLAAVRKRGLTSDMSSGEGDVPFAHTWVMGLLSVTKTIRFPDHAAPQVRVAAKMANNSR